MTKVKLNTMVTLHTRFRDDNNKIHEAEIPFMVLESKCRDVIIGMPSLVVDFGELFKAMVSRSLDKYVKPGLRTNPIPIPPEKPPVSELLLLEPVFFAGFDHPKAPIAPDE